MLYWQKLSECPYVAEPALPPINGDVDSGLVVRY
jgi:hypothetical protein